MVSKVVNDKGSQLGDAVRAKGTTANKSNAILEGTWGGVTRKGRHMYTVIHDVKEWTGPNEMWREPKDRVASVA